MKLETSVSLSAECVRELDALTDEGTSRSALIEEAVVQFIERRRRQSRGAKGREIMAAHAKSLEQDVRETLEFQAPE